MMARHTKEVRILADICKPYGYYIKETKNHRKIINREGRIIYSFPGSPSDGNFYKQVLRDLRRLGHINV